MKMNSRLRDGVTLALVLALTGCGDSSSAPDADPYQTKVEVKILSSAYLSAIVEIGKSPSKVEDLKLPDSGMVKAVKNGKYVVVWDVPTKADEKTIILYEKDAPTRGGFVATLDGEVTKMTPQEFRAAPKAAGR